MPPHCDTKDGPVVKAARQALAAGNVKIILPYVYKAGESEVEEMFGRVSSVLEKHGNNQVVRELAESWFFENVVRIHRAGEGAPYTGLKPAGLSEGPVIPVAERAITEKDPRELIEKLVEIVTKETNKRFDRLLQLEKTAEVSVDEAREYVEAMLGLQVWSHKLYQAATAEIHGAKQVSGHQPEEVHRHG